MIDQPRLFGADVEELELDLGELHELRSPRGIEARQGGQDQKGRLLQGRGHLSMLRRPLYTGNHLLALANQ